MQTLVTGEPRGLAALLALVTNLVADMKATYL